MRENIGINLYDLEFGNGFLGMSLKAKVTKGKTRELGLQN